jgi:hypothetical protein
MADQSIQTKSASNLEKNLTPKQYRSLQAREKFEQTMMPTKNKPAILAYYFGIAGFVPFIGLPFSYLAIKYARKALLQYKDNPTPGAKGHAKAGLFLAYFELAVFVLFVAVMIYFYLTRPDK